MSNSSVPRGPGLFEVGRATGERMVTNVRRIAGGERAPGSVLIGAAAWLLALVGAGALYVSFSAQRQYVFGARHQDAASIIEALLLDVLLIVFTLLALGLSRRGQVRADRAGADPGVRDRVGVHERRRTPTPRRRAAWSPTRWRRSRSPSSWTESWP